MVERVKDVDIIDILDQLESDSGSDDTFDEVDFISDVEEDILDHDEIPLLDEHPPVIHPVLEDDVPMIEVVRKKKILYQYFEYCNAEHFCKPSNFTAKPGVNVPVNNYNNPYELFKLFFTDELVDEIVIQTNLYAEKFLANRVLKRYSRFNSWKPVTRDEMFVLMAVYMLSGFIWKPRVDDYYTKNKIFSTPGFSTLMSLNRVKLLSRFLHFTDIDTPQNKKLYKIKPVLDYLCKRFQDVYTLERNIAVDESLMLWKGRLSIKQFIRIKRARFGVKSYVVSESSSGYIQNIIIYAGNETDITPINNCGYSTCVVLSILEHGLLDKGYCVYTDNYYCSPELAVQLKKRKTDLVGTVQRKRVGVPKEFAHKKIQKNEFTALMEKNGEFMLFKWLDKRQVMCLTTIHKLSCTNVKRKGKDALVPNIINDYNINMGGVDKVDQMLSAYPLERKRQKVWYKKEFRHLINLSIFNAHVIHGKGDGKMTSLQFRENLVEAIIENHLTGYRPPVGRPPSLPESGTRLSGRHFPEYVPATCKKKNRSRRCVVCSQQKIRKESRYQCAPCDVGLCAAPCFMMYHTKKNY